MIQFSCELIKEALSADAEAKEPFEWYNKKERVWDERMGKARPGAESPGIRPENNPVCL